jgi:hypothetical protein
MDQTRILALKKKADEEQRPGFLERLSAAKRGALEGADSWLQENVVNPISEAGYPNVGAGLGTAASTGLQVAADRIPTSSEELAMSLPVGRVIKPIQKMANKTPAAADAISATLPSALSGKPGSRLPEDVYNQFFDQIAPIARGDVPKFNAAMAQMESAWLKQNAEAAAKQATANMTGVLEMKTADQVRNLFAKSKPDAVVREATTSAVAPKQTARQADTYREENMKALAERMKNK